MSLGLHHRFLPCFVVHLCSRLFNVVQGVDFLGSVVDGQRIFVPHAVQMRYKYRQKSVKMHRNLTISLNGVKIQLTENQLNSDECVQMPMRGYFPMQNNQTSDN